jgi:hypothetical protein
MQPVGTFRQIRRPGDDPIMGLALRDNLKIRNDFPAQRERGSLAEFGPRGLAGPNHYRMTEKSARRLSRLGIEDNPQRRRVRHMPVTLPVDKFGLDSEVFSSDEKVH